MRHSDMTQLLRKLLQVARSNSWQMWTRLTFREQCKTSTSNRPCLSLWAKLSRLLKLCSMQGLFAPRLSISTRNKNRRLNQNMLTSLKLTYVQFPQIWNRQASLESPAKTSSVSGIGSAVVTAFLALSAFSLFLSTTDSRLSTSSLKGSTQLIRTCLKMLIATNWPQMDRLWWVWSDSTTHMWLRSNQEPSCPIHKLCFVSQPTSNNSTWKAMGKESRERVFAWLPASRLVQSFWANLEPTDNTVFTSWCIRDAKCRPNLSGSPNRKPLSTCRENQCRITTNSCQTSLLSQML